MTESTSYTDFLKQKIRMASYAEQLETLSARTMTECHRLTERRAHEILRGVRQPHDVVVTAI